MHFMQSVLLFLAINAPCQLFSNLPKGSKTIFCEMSTIAPTLTRTLHKRAIELGAGYLATPIFGLPPR
jgi:3-hydroxyisobutyrate dehydrogenase-like beta-hydroxyacid dehydrogenase